MSIQFILGGSGCGKTYYIQHFLSEEAKHFPNRNYIFIVPEQFTMQTQKELISLSDAKGIMNIDVQSFLRLAFKVMGETGTGNTPVLDDMGKTMVLKKVLTKIEKELLYFGKNIRKEGYVQEIKSFLSEMYQYGITEDGMDEMIDAARNHPLLVRKLKDMKLIYQAFVQYRKEKFITSEELLTVLADVAEESDLLKDSVICFDGFTGFTPTQYQFIEKLIRIAKKVYLTVTIDKQSSILKVGDKHALFYMSQKTIYHFRKIAEENGVEVCPEIWTGSTKEETRFAEAPGIEQIEKRIFRYPVVSYLEVPEDISVHVVKQPEDEIKFVIEQIRELIQEKNSRYQDIAVITGNPDDYAMLAKEMFGRAGIPCFIDQKKGIEENPFVQLIDYVLDIFLYHFPAEKMMQYEKNIFTPATDEQCDLLDNFLRATGIRGKKKWEEVWSVDKVFTGNVFIKPSMFTKNIGEIRVLLDMVRQDTVDSLFPLYERIGKGKHVLREYATAICTWFEEERFYSKIMQYVEGFEEQNELSAAWEYRQIYKIVLGVFDRLVELLGEEEMSLKEFKEVLDTGFAEARIGLIPPGVDQVVVGDMNRTRLAHIKYLFFLGMSDGNIPVSGGGGGVISDSERLFLSEQEFELAPTIREKIYTEQFYLYLNLTKPSRHLYLTYPQTNNAGKAQNPAYIIARLHKIFPKINIVYEEERQDDRYLLGTSMGMDYLIRGLRDRKYDSNKWKEIYSFYQEDEERKKRLHKILQAAFYKENKSNLSEEVVRRLYREVLYGSTSQFEQYAACAFAYFMKYGLHLKERKEHQVAYFDIGNVVHQALEYYTRELTERKERWENISKEEQEKRVDRIIEQTVANYKNGLLQDTKRDAYLVIRLKRILLRTIWGITKQMEQGDFDTVSSEISFCFAPGKSGKELLEDIEIITAEDSKPNAPKKENRDALQLIGRIDRIDAMQEQDAYYIKIVDYKTGKKDISLEDMYYGLQMQLLIYLKAGIADAKEQGKQLVIPAGVLYYHIDDPMVSGKKETAEIESELLKALKMDGIINEADVVLRGLDHNLWKDGGIAASATSNIVPVATKKDGTFKANSKTISSEDFDKLTEYIDYKLRAISQDIMSGNVTAEPYRKAGSNHENACEYCAYHGICHFDTKLAGNQYRILPKLSETEVFMKIKEEVAGEQLKRGGENE